MFHRIETFSSSGTKIVIKLIRLAFGLQLIDFDDSEVIKDLRKLESIAISFGILPNGFAQDKSLIQTRWTRTKSIIYSILMAMNIFNLLSLCIFNLSESWSIILGDFFYGHRSRRYFWIYLTIYSIFGEVLRQHWIHIYNKRKSFSFHMYTNVFKSGFNPEALSMSRIYCRKYRFMVSNLSNFWIRFMIICCTSIGPVLIMLVQIVSQLPKTPKQFMFTYFWLFIHYFGVVASIVNTMLTAAIITMDLSYFYLRAAHVFQSVKNFVDKKVKVINILSCEKVVREIIVFLNETEYLNFKLRNWLIFLYLGLSFVADFGFYSSTIIHIDRGALDLFLLLFAIQLLVGIGTCSYVNGLMLTMMHACAKKIIKVAGYLPPDRKLFIKLSDLQNRLSRTDIAFTIGQILDMTTRVFVIYLVENACLIMMLVLNIK